MRGLRGCMYPFMICMLLISLTDRCVFSSEQFLSQDYLMSGFLGRRHVQLLKYFLSILSCSKDEMNFRRYHFLETTLDSFNTITYKNTPCHFGQIWNFLFISPYHPPISPTPPTPVPAPLQNEVSPNRWDCNFQDSVVHLSSCLSFQFDEGYRHSSWVFVKVFIYSGTSYPPSAWNILCRFFFPLLLGASKRRQPLCQEERNISDSGFICFAPYSFMSVSAVYGLDTEYTLRQQTGRFRFGHESLMHFILLWISLSSMHTEDGRFHFINI